MFNVKENLTADERKTFITALEEFKKLNKNKQIMIRENCYSEFLLNCCETERKKIIELISILKHSDENIIRIVKTTQNLYPMAIAQDALKHYSLLCKDNYIQGKKIEDVKQKFGIVF